VIRMLSPRHSAAELQPSLAGLVSEWDQKGVALLTGTSGIYFLAHLWQFQLVLKGLSIHTVDCAIRFDSYAIAEEALRNQVSPEDIHDKITVSRCFTPYQILDEMNHLLKLPQSTGRLNFILAPSKQFFDGDVSRDESSFLLKKLSNLFADFQKKSIPLMVVEKEAYPNPGFKSFFADIQKLAHPFFHLRLTEKKQEKHIKKFYSVRIVGTENRHITGAQHG